VSNHEHNRLITFLQRYKGDIALALSFILYLLSWPIARIDHTSANVMRAAGEASLVGGLCDYIALNMIFEQHWYLAGRGSAGAGFAYCDDAPVHAGGGR
jgi:drug/metabolite transporter (DMT)-like permease